MVVKVYLANGETVTVPQGQTAAFESLMVQERTDSPTEVGAFLKVLDRLGYGGVMVAAFRKEEVLGFVVVVGAAEKVGDGK